jgi:uncharacterized membrane protein
MLQGHTISALGDFSEIDKSSFVYQVWIFIRGITAPLFIFTAGTVFVYLLKINGSFFSGSRVRKGLVRFMVLLTIGYLLNFPTLRIFDFADVTDSRWLKFFSVDALHLIAFGILFLIVTRYISYKTNISEFLLYIFVSIAVLIITPFVLDVNWQDITNPLFASYFTYETGSYFPLFPFLFYIFAGGTVGFLLRNNNNLHKKPVFSITLLGSGIFLFIIPIIADSIFYNELVEINYLRTDVLLTVKRLGVVLLLTGLLSIALSKYEKMPEYILSPGRNSLIIYVLHLVLIYGCVLFPGLTFIWKNSLSITISVLTAITITIIFTILSILHDRKKLKFEISAS